MWYGKFFVQYNAQMVMASCQLAYETVPELSGIFYTHFHRTEGRHGKVQLVDAHFMEYEIDLDEAPFYLQNYGELVIARIHKQMKAGRLSEAIISLQILFEAIESWSLKGLQVKHPAIRRNIGFCGDRVLLLDVGSLHQTDRVQDPTFVYQQIKLVTARLRRWLLKHYPELYPYYQEELGKRQPDVSSEGRYSKRSPG
jgi:hypothetical protein